MRARANKGRPRPHTIQRAAVRCDKQLGHFAQRLARAPLRLGTLRTRTKTGGSAEFEAFMFEDATVQKRTPLLPCAGFSGAPE